MGEKAPFLKSKFLKKIHKASKNENQPPPENRTRIDYNERAKDPWVFGCKTTQNYPF
jgi:hypothetical protein